MNELNIKGFHNVWNAMMARTGVQPEVGMGATILMYTDRYAATISDVIKTKSGKISYILIQQDISTRTDENGMSEYQSYNYAPNEKAPKRRFSLRKNGLWVESSKYHTMWNGTKLSIGERDSYHDYSF